MPNAMLPSSTGLSAIYARFCNEYFGKRGVCFVVVLYIAFILSPQLWLIVLVLAVDTVNHLY